MSAVLGVSLHALGRGKRPILMAVLLAVPVLLALAYVESDPHPHGAKFSIELLDVLFLPVLLPLTALVFATSALGGEIEDGTLIYLTLRPLSRLAIVAAKLLASIGVTAVLVELAILLTYLASAAGALDGRVAFASLVAGLAGCIVYCSVFLAVGLFLPRRGLIVGLGYVLAWEGSAAGLSSALGTLSLRRYVRSTLHAGLGSSPLANLQHATAGGTASVVILAVVVLASAGVAVMRLRTLELR